ncbi:hypothetical protein GCM10009740_02040 [Terrabacter terrae]|uniref:Uncharacterized protein n=1 Tax=Terrabacter terrae TaxID=318434 RepID=A0ABN2TR74_9MICO
MARTPEQRRIAWRERPVRERRPKTYNADENAPMRRINDALGFRPHVLSGRWRLDL